LRKVGSWVEKTVVMLVLAMAVQMVETMAGK
jgi:hypothetical protein